MGRRKYKASLSTAGGLYVFSPAGACPLLRLPHYVLLLYSWLWMCHHGPPAQKAFQTTES